MFKTIWTNRAFDSEAIAVTAQCLAHARRPTSENSHPANFPSYAWSINSRSWLVCHFRREYFLGASADHGLADSSIVFPPNWSPPMLFITKAGQVTTVLKPSFNEVSQRMVIYSVCGGHLHASYMKENNHRSIQGAFSTKL